MITEFVDVFMFLLSLTGFEAVLKYQELLKNMENEERNERQIWAIGDFSSLTNMASNIQRFFESLNKIGSGFALLWSCMVIPSLSLNTANSLPGTISTTQKRDEESLVSETIAFFQTWLFVLLYGLTFYLAAETNKKVHEIFY